MTAISVNNLKKYYSVHQKQPGLIGSLKSLFSRKYYDICAVDDISFSVKEGELVGFIGPNGAGKTTTLKCLSGLLHPQSGEVKVLGFTPKDRKEAFLKSIALVMGHKNQLWWDLPPMETFLLNKEIYGIGKTEFEKTLGDLTTLLSVSELVNVPVRKLSLGERMKCELIAALLHQPKMLFLDEPTIGLDVVMQKTMRDFIAIYNQRYRATILLTSHYMEDVSKLCQRVLIIDKGKLIYDGDLAKIVERYAPLKILSVTFDEYTDIRSLARIGKIRHFSFPHAVIAVPREQATKRASMLLKQFAVVDVNIEEPKIEDIIREVFSTKGQKKKI